MTPMSVFVTEGNINSHPSMSHTPWDPETRRSIAAASLIRIKALQAKALEDLAFERDS